MKNILTIYFSMKGQTIGPGMKIIHQDTVLIRFPLYCPKCKREFRINVVQLKMVQSDEPDA